MRIVAIGGAGYVGRLVLPHLREQHEVRVFDARPPDTEEDPESYAQGDVTDPPALTRAVAGVDAVLYMAMGSTDWDTDRGVTSAFDVNVKGVHLALRAAHHAGVTHAVYTSSMSVYERPAERYFVDEDLTPDARDLYGFTKRLGEQACANASRRWGMSTVALRLCHPRPDGQWLDETRPGEPTIATTATDVARALLAALTHRGHGFQAFTISGDYEQAHMNMTRAARILGWAPKARPRRPAG